MFSGRNILLPSGHHVLSVYQVIPEGTHPKLTLSFLNMPLWMTPCVFRVSFVFFPIQRHRRWRPPHQARPRKKTKWKATGFLTSRRNPLRQEVNTLLQRSFSQAVTRSKFCVSFVEPRCDGMSPGIKGAQLQGKGGASLNDEIYISKIKCHLGSQCSQLSSGLIRYQQQSKVTYRRYLIRILNRLWS